MLVEGWKKTEMEKKKSGRIVHPEKERKGHGNVPRAKKQGKWERRRVLRTASLVLSVAAVQCATRRAARAAEAGVRTHPSGATPPLTQSSEH